MKGVQSNHKLHFPLVWINGPLLLILLLASRLVAQIHPIVSIYPAQNAQHVPLDATIFVTFDREMDAASFNNTTFIVHGSQTGRLSGTYSYYAGIYTATFTPSGTFKAGEQVRITLTTGIQSTVGSTLANPHTSARFPHPK